MKKSSGGAAGSLSSLRQLHARLVRMSRSRSKSREDDMSASLLSSLLSLSFSPSLLSYAHSLLSSPPCRSALPFNLLIRALSSSSSWHSPLLALRYFRLLLRRSIAPDAFTFPLVFRASAAAAPSSLPLAFQSHSLALRLGFLPRHPHTAHSLLTLYASCARPASARRLFDEIPPRHLDLVSWNSIISAYVRMGLPREALRLFTRMLALSSSSSCSSSSSSSPAPSPSPSPSSPRPNHITLLPLLSACAHLADLQTGRWLEAYLHTANLSHIQAQGQAPSFLASALIHMYAKCGALDDSRRVFDSVPCKDTFVWNSMITGYVCKCKCKC